MYHAALRFLMTIRSYLIEILRSNLLCTASLGHRVLLEERGAKL